jgi:hypothetical protein
VVGTLLELTDGKAEVVGLVEGSMVGLMVGNEVGLRVGRVLGS